MPWQFSSVAIPTPTQSLSELFSYPKITLVDARSRRDDARKLVAEGKNPSEVRKVQKIPLQTESENAFEKIG